MWTLEQTEKHLVKLASEGVTRVFYSELYLLADVDVNNGLERQQFNDLLGDVSIKHHAEGRPMLSVIVVGKTGNHRPGGGFFGMARGHNDAYKGLDKETIFITELNRVIAYAPIYAEMLQAMELESYTLTEEDRAVIAQTMELTYLEGSKLLVSSYQYERNPLARKRCIDKYGFNCAVCGFNFGDDFGEIGEGFIHVHHLSPLSQHDGEHEVDPIKDLRPVCPNCHAMLHKKMPPYSIEELKQIRKNAQS